MYVTDGWGRVYAIDMTSGKKGMFRWRFDPEIDRAWAGDVACCGVNNRGVALWKDKVISISLDGRMFALNKATGEKVWERKIADPGIAETLTLAPLVVRDVAIVGTAGGEYGIRGFIDGTDLNTGQAGLAHLHDSRRRRARQRDLEGRQGALEARRRLDLGDRDLRSGHRHVLSGHRQCRPRLRSGIPPRRQQMGRKRARALARATARSNGGSSTPRTTPTTSTRSPSTRSSTLKVNGEDRKLVVHAARNGFYYALDRVNGSFVVGKQYVDELNWTPGLDPKTGLPLNYDPTKDVQVYAPGSHGLRGVPGTRLCPSNSGGKNWAPSAYNPGLNLMYLPTVEGCNAIATAEQKDFVDQGGTVKPRERFAGGGTTPLRNEKRYGALKAIDPVTGETKANLKLAYPNRSGAARDRRQPRVQRADGRQLRGL